MAKVLLAAAFAHSCATRKRDGQDGQSEPGDVAPKGMDLAVVHRHIVDTDGVIDAHDLHVWTITSGMPVLSCHVVVDDAAFGDDGGGRVLDRLGDCLADHFVEHCTFQLEPAGHASHERAAH